MTINTLVYPYDNDFLTVLRHSFHPQDIAVTKFVSPGGWGFAGKDAADIDYGPSLGFLISADFEAELQKVDAVFFAQSMHKLDFGKYILPKIKLAITAHKKIFCTIKLESQLVEEISTLAKDNSVDFVYFDDFSATTTSEFEILDSDTVVMREIGVPVVMVMGLMENLGKFDVQLDLYRHIKDKGYTPAMITSRSYGALGGQHSIPSYMYGRGHTELEKIVLFNHFVKQIEVTESPDLIIIGVPGGIIPTNKKVLNYFGTLAFEISRAVNPDTGIVCVQYNQYLESFFDKLSNLCEYRFSCDLAGFIISNTSVEMHAQAVPHNVSHMILPDAALSNLEDHKQFSHIISTGSAREAVFEEVIKRLESFASFTAY